VLRVSVWRANVRAQPWWTLGIAELLWPTQASDYTPIFLTEQKKRASKRGVSAR
jgi:hypothetical protein